MKQDITHEQFIEEMLKMGVANEQAKRLLLLSDTRKGYPYPREALVNLVRQGQFVSAVGIVGGAAAKE